MSRCPVCGSSSQELAVSKETLDQECALRERFIEERLTRPATEAERKDLTDFFHQGRAQLNRCTSCCQLLRHEFETPPAGEYAKDCNSFVVMEQQYGHYRNAFRAKQSPYRGLLSPGSHIAEIGSHYGAFLDVAREWGWSAEGIDVGKDTSEFARSKGFSVFQGELPERAFPDSHLDGLFIWNCFEQIPDPHPLLDEAHRVLKPRGLLVLRTPNAQFYSMCRALLDDPATADSQRAFVIDALGYNNLLGFPYLYGYDAARLSHCAAIHGFETGGAVNSELLTLPLPEDPAWVEREERIITQNLTLIAQWTLKQSSGVLIRPWVEVWFRRN